MNIQKSINKIVRERESKKRKYERVRKVLVLVTVLFLGIFIGSFFMQSNFSITGYVASGVLPTVGGDSGNWGTILNNYLSQEHTEEGGHKNVTISGDLNVSGNFNVIGNTNLTGNLIVGGEINSSGLNVAGNTNITGNLTLGDKITFKLGGVIDNLVSGWIRITESLNVVGDLNVSGEINSTGLNVDGTITATAIIGTKGYLNGLELSNNAVDITNDIDIATGQAVDNSNENLMILSSSITKKLDASWSAGNGNGGLDTGTIANTTYHVWIIGKTDGTTDALFSTSATSPTMPSGYTLKRRIGSIIRVSGAILKFHQSGDKFILESPFTEFTDNNPASTRQTKTLTRIPSGLNVIPVITWRLTDYGTVGDQMYMVITKPEWTDVTPGGQKITMLLESNDITNQVIVDYVPVNTARQISYKLVRAGSEDASQYVAAFVQGWIDTRGK